MYTVRQDKSVHDVFWLSCLDIRLRYLNEGSTRGLMEPSNGISNKIYVREMRRQLRDFVLNTFLWIILAVLDLLLR